MSQKELSRVQVLSLVLEGQLALQNAAARLGVSVRQARRLLRRLEAGGPARWSMAIGAGPRPIVSTRRPETACSFSPRPATRTATIPTWWSSSPSAKA